MSVQTPAGAVGPRIDAARLALGDWWKELDLPIDWDGVLPGGPLCVEVGFGGGEFLLAMAGSEPGMRFIGVERYAEGHRRLLKRVGEEGLRNVLTMVGDAFIILNLTFSDASLERITVNFSDPWPKARHASRRLLTPEFLRLAARKLRDGGRFYAATDDVPYARQALESFFEVPALRSLHPEVPWLAESPHPMRTRYESKWMAEGRPLHYFIYERKEPSCPT